MSQTVRTACPLDCFDACGLIATVDGDRVTRIAGDPDHPLTRGRICPKGKAILSRTVSPDRLTTPLRRQRGGGFKPVSPEAALDELADRLASARARHGPASVLHFAYDGYTGLIKTIDSVFFNHFAQNGDSGVTRPRGSLCWGAGMAAQRYDFGDVRGHAPEDIPHARTLILWGRNPAHTNVHLLDSVRAARRAGATVVLIDPVRTATARMADHHIRIRPGADGILALGMANEIIRKGWVDPDFISRRVLGFHRFAASIEDLDPERVEGMTGVSAETLRWLARQYALGGPACILIGYGLQRYANGGNTVRAIDALGAITGRIGISGGGVNYANRSAGRFLGGVLARSREMAPPSRTFPIGRLGRFLETVTDPPIDVAVVTKANPAVQAPEIDRVVRGLSDLPFTVVIDPFLTDTARCADLVLPATSVLEEQDLIISSMFSPYVNPVFPAVHPPEGVMSEYDLFAALARRLNLTDYPFWSRRDYLESLMTPLLERFSVTLADLEAGYFRIPDSAVPWAEGPFATPSGRFELFSASAAADGHDPLPAVRFPAEPGDKGAAYPFRLLTPHPRHSIHSQHFRRTDGRPVARIHPETLQSASISDKDTARLESAGGSLTVRVRADRAVPPDLVAVDEGYWHKSGPVNRLTSAELSDMGEGAAFNDCFCRIEPHHPADDKTEPEVT